MGGLGSPALVCTGPTHLLIVGKAGSGGPPTLVRAGRSIQDSSVVVANLYRDGSPALDRTGTRSSGHGASGRPGFRRLTRAWPRRRFDTDLGIGAIEDREWLTHAPSRRPFNSFSASNACSTDGRGSPALVRAGRSTWCPWPTSTSRRRGFTHARSRRMLNHAWTAARSGRRFTRARVRRQRPERRSASWTARSWVHPRSFAQAGSTRRVGRTLGQLGREAGPPTLAYAGCSTRCREARRRTSAWFTRASLHRQFNSAQLDSVSAPRGSVHPRSFAQDVQLGAPTAPSSVRFAQAVQRPFSEGSGSQQAKHGFTHARSRRTFNLKPVQVGRRVHGFTRARSRRTVVCAGWFNRAPACRRLRSHEHWFTRARSRRPFNWRSSWWSSTRSTRWVHLRPFAQDVQPRPASHRPAHDAWFTRTRSRGTFHLIDKGVSGAKDDSPALVCAGCSTPSCPRRRDRWIRWVDPRLFAQDVQRRSPVPCAS